MIRYGDEAAYTTALASQHSTNAANVLHQISMFFVMGTSMTKNEEKSLIGLLTRYIEIFAWTFYDIPGINLEVACYKLNVDP